MEIEKQVLCLEPLVGFGWNQLVQGLSCYENVTIFQESSNTYYLNSKQLLPIIALGCIWWICKYAWKELCTCCRAFPDDFAVRPSNYRSSVFMVPTAMSDNNLAVLPTELLHNILSYSIWNTPDGSRTSVAVTTGGKPELWTNHTYYTVAATSRHLRDVVESFCRHLIILHKSTTKLQPPAKKSKNPTPNRVRWVKWTAKHCIFCGKETTCMALMYSSIRCCRKCDKKEWPDKIVSPLELV